MDKNIKIAENFMVYVSWEKNENWQLTSQLSSVEEYIDELTLTLSSENEAEFPQMIVDFRIPKGNIASRWNVNLHLDKTLLPEWGAAFTSELASGAPVLSLINQDGSNAMCCSVSDALRRIVWTSGVKEHTFEISTKLKFFTMPEPKNNFYMVKLRFDRRKMFFSEVISQAFEELGNNPQYAPSVTPEAGFAPLYSTWYSYHKDITDHEIEAECAIAKKNGMDLVIVDDGWQSADGICTYACCGDWEVAPNRSLDMAAHVQRIHDIGMKYMLCYSVPFLGFDSKNYSKFKDKCLYKREVGRVAVLDPRFPEVRQFLIDLYCKALKDWKLDGFKLDFIDRLALPENVVDLAIAENYANRDFKSIPQATDVLMTGIMKALKAIKPDILIEFRQKYIGPAIRKYGNMLRAADCPGDITANRIRITDLRLSSGTTAVHGDMLRWDYNESVESAAKQLLAVLYSVPQISIKFNEISIAHQEMIRYRLDFYKKHLDTLVKGKFIPFFPDMNYPLLRGESSHEAITTVYVDGLKVSCSKLGTNFNEIVVNASCSSEVLVNLPCNANAVIHDCCGKIVNTITLNVGLSVIEVPISGDVEFSAK